MNDFTTPQTLHAVGLGAGFIFSGFSICASFLVVPLICDLPARQATPFFKGFFYNGAAFAVPISLLSSASMAVGSYLLSSSNQPTAVEGSYRGWKSSTLGYVAAAALIMNMPWTRLVMMSGINRLIALSADPVASDKAGREVVELLRTWQWHNYVRAAFAFTGGLLGFAALAGQR